MKKTRIHFAMISLLLVCTIVVNLTGCAMEIQAKNLMEGITPNNVNALDDLSSQNADVTDFAVRLFKASNESGKNTLISPLSVLYALAMTANGAEGETLAQMEEVLGMTVRELNLYFYSYMKNLPQGDKYKLSLANSIWFTEDGHFTANQDFLQTNADYYGADIYKAPFDDRTCKDINNWVNQKTDGMVPKILEQIPPEAVMYLINTLAFDAEWKEIYKEDRVSNGKFTKEDGTEQDAVFMASEEDLYLEDEKATGFMKYYKDDKYAFVVMLPKEGVSVSEYIASLNGESLHTMLANPHHTKVITRIPKFEVEYDVEMSKILKSMGMPAAFDANKAEFNGLGTSTAGNINISSVIHKTFISVDERGTKAGAATAVGMGAGGMPSMVICDRPFVYMLIDCENNIPFFIGTMMDVGT